ncbi:urease accessory protein UreE [Aureimonas leprariae]|uniref:Urease accessory protein UreE n=1 Tax=Plantimonas leprariae TaxID=2615207 RepID=A0A7V7PNI6_9HYPH|nr:urease accessory protein UreE [Aureimonas leprariae]KAB0679286.1 urease accessory protein UreE [Aureimonas leprariae]
MIRAETIRERGEGFQAADTITLDETQRHRRRMAMVSDGGIAFLLDLADARLLREGDAIVLDDGRLVRVIAKPEPLYAVRGRNAAHLLSLAWHLGNRHTPAAIMADHLLVRRDPVLREMAVGLGGSVEEVEAPFDPEGGAYGGHHAHGDESRPLTGGSHL